MNKKISNYIKGCLIDVDNLKIDVSVIAHNLTNQLSTVEDVDIDGYKDIIYKISLGFLSDYISDKNQLRAIALKISNFIWGDNK